MAAIIVKMVPSEKVLDVFHSEMVPRFGESVKIRDQKYRIENVVWSRDDSTKIGYAAVILEVKKCT